jgi:hypothetical protein
MANFRHGQWVKFDVPEASVVMLDKAHKAKDGKYVGIFQNSKTDTFDELLEQHVVAVKEDGSDAVFFDGEKVHRCSFNPAILINLEPLLDNADLPPGRIVREGFSLRA